MDLQDADTVFIEPSGGSKYLSGVIESKPAGFMKSIGERGSTQQLEYQHYLLNSDEACLIVIKYAGSDGGGDVTSGGTPVGSVSILADICEPGTEQLTSQRREQWIESFNYRQQ